ncbi:ThuA domain-containing protein [Microbacterium sp. HMH0099]|uniref:ThuA domain-containing protein n=1 Tax=Microbacterium sp. HMH0099 TaxID=3414026 RepID=UPI003BF6A4DD
MPQGRGVRNLEGETVARRSAVVVRGGWDGHHPVAATEMFLPFLHENGFDVRIEDSPRVYADAAVMDRADVIVQSLTMGEADAESIAGLRRAVEAGTGLAGWHGGIVDAFRASADYLQLVGGQFAAHPAADPGERVGDGSDFFVDHRYETTERGRVHEITRGVGDFSLRTEQYWVLHDDANDVLMTTTHPVRAHEPWHRPIVSPAVWTRSWGAGRVFVATPGHDPGVLADPHVRTIVERGLLWAAR